MAQSKTSKMWLKEHFDDKFVKQAKIDGYRSRASYKLVELNEKDKLLKPGQIVIDLGAAPGGWSQVAVQKVGDTGIVIASDILDMDPIAGVEFVKGDFTEEFAYQQIVDIMGNKKADLVISDMAPNMSGMKGVDQPKSMYLVELALDMAKTLLKPGGVFVAKVFQGEGYQELLGDCKASFTTVITRKPESSRARSTEMYIVAKAFKG